MFEAIELGQTLGKQEFKDQEEEFRTKLLMLQRELQEANVATLIIVSGVEGSGKGEVVDNLNKWFDSRGMETHAFWDETDEEKERPDYWRYWMRLPPRGNIGIMFGGWYWEPIHAHTDKELDDASLDEHARRIKEFERMLRADGLLIVKLWFHLSYDEHKKRLKQRSRSPHPTNYKEDEKEVQKRYQDFLLASERVIRHTDIPEAPWYLIEADDGNFRDASVAKVLLQQISHRLTDHRRGGDRRVQTDTPVVTLDGNPVTILDKVDTEATIDKDEYKKQLKFYQEKLAELSWQAYHNKHSTVIVFEGWDAAGKGGALRRVTSAIDARLYRGISVAAPTDEEIAHHYLWRFWRQIPRAGYMTIYDRSWYGRVLVERVEDFASPQEWRRAYQEINSFEEQLANNGVIVVKFWLHISAEEQLQRFEERQNIPWKQHKLTEEDWRNRDKWGDYTQAVNEMIVRTSTSKAPWHIVAGNDKRFARIDVLKHVCERLQSTLKPEE